MPPTLSSAIQTARGTRRAASLVSSEVATHASSSPVLSRRVIADTALTIIDEEGTEALTLRRIAQRLRVRAPSLYNHVSSREDILDAVTESINSRLDLGAVADPHWRRGLIAFAHSYRRAYADHPNAVPLIAARDVRTEISVAGYDAMLHRLSEVGWAALTALEIMLMIDQLVLGSAITPFAALPHIPAETAKGTRHWPPCSPRPTPTPSTMRPSSSR